MLSAVVVFYFAGSVVSMLSADTGAVKNDRNLLRECLLKGHSKNKLYIYIYICICIFTRCRSFYFSRFVAYHSRVSRRTRVHHGSFVPRRTTRASGTAFLYTARRVGRILLAVVVFTDDVFIFSPTAPTLKYYVFIKTNLCETISVYAGTFRLHQLCIL